MADERPQEAAASQDESEVKVSVRFADRACPRCHSRFVASYYRDDAYVKSRCLDCMLFWPTPLMA
jgi:NMD protein affecting ribosome stability and mRNA decay